jgi:hypothetical protein
MGDWRLRTGFLIEDEIENADLEIDVLALDAFTCETSVGFECLKE